MSLYDRETEEWERSEQQFVKGCSGGAIRLADSTVLLEEAGRFQVGLARILKYLNHRIGSCSED